MSDIDFQKAILEKLEQIHETLSEHRTELALTKQASATVEHRVTKAENHIDDLRQAKWKLAGAVAGLSGLASFLGSKLAGMFSQGSQPPH